MSIKEIIESKFGKGSVFRISDMENRIREDNFISTGSKALNYILTGNSKCGWPKGRVVEIFGNEGTGKTTLALYACSEVNKSNFETLYIDVENAIDIEYAKKIGINPDLFFLTQPDCGEEAFSIAEEFLKENEKCKLIIFDSVANLVPRAEIEGDIDSNNMGLHARLMGKGLRRLVSLINKKKACCIFVNQIRMKIGGYGCLHYNTKIHLCDNIINVGKLFKDKIKNELISFDECKKRFVKSKIKKYYNNDYANSKSDFIKICFQCTGRSSYQTAILTKTHKVLTNEKWKMAKDLKKGDNLVSYVESLISCEQEQIIIGSLLGDGQISKKTDLSYCFILRNSKQLKYLKWKVKNLNCFDFKSKNNVSYFSNWCQCLQKYYNMFYNNKLSYMLEKRLKNHYRKKYRGFNEDLVNKIDLLALMVWFLDDGHSDVKRGIKDNVEQPRKKRCASICMKRFKYIENFHIYLKMIIERINKLGYKVYSEKYNIVFDYNEFKKFSNDIKEYVVPEMQYKLLQEHRGFYKEKKIKKLNNPNLDIFFVKFLNIKQISRKESKILKKYDISVKHSNYMIGSNKNMNGIVVHNSPQVTTGGLALKFYSTIRMEIRTPRSGKIIENRGDLSDIIKPKENIETGITMNIKVVKNKIYPPFRECSLSMIYGVGIDKQDDLISYFESVGLISLNGKKIEFEGKTYLRDKFLKMIEEKQFKEEIKSKIAQLTNETKIKIN